MSTLIKIALELISIASGLINIASELINIGSGLINTSSGLINIAPALINIAPALINIAPALISIAPALISIAPALISKNAVNLNMLPCCLNKALKSQESGPQSQQGHRAPCSTPKHHKDNEQYATMAYASTPSESQAAARVTYPTRSFVGARF